MAKVVESRHKDGVGILVLQDFRDKTADERSCILGVRVRDRLALGHYVHEERTVGDLIGWALWPVHRGRNIPAWSTCMPVAVRGGGGESSRSNNVDLLTAGGDFFAATAGGQFGFTGGTIKGGSGAAQGSGNAQAAVVGIKVAEDEVPEPPIVQPMSGRAFGLDPRFFAVVPTVHRFWPRFPDGYTGLTVATTDVREQVLQFHPTDPRLVAANFGGPFQCGSFVVDLEGAGGAGSAIAPGVRRDRLGGGGDSNKIDTERQARLHSFLRVLKSPDDQAGLRGRRQPAGGVRPAPGETQTSPVVAGGSNALSWNLGKSGQGDAYGGYAHDIPTVIVTAPRRGRSGPVSGTGPDFATGGGGGKGVAGGLAPGTLASELRFIPGIGWVRPDFTFDSHGPDGTFRSLVLSTAEALAEFNAEQGKSNPIEIFPSSRAGPVRSELGAAEGTLVIGKWGVADGGPLDPGDIDDKHKMGNDADGNPINIGHISCDALYRNRSNPRQDSPLLFERLDFIEGGDFDIVTRVHLLHDPTTDFWRWQTSSFFETVELPPPPPPGEVPPVPVPRPPKPPTTPPSDVPPVPVPKPPTTSDDPGPPPVVPPGTGSGIPGTPGTPLQKQRTSIINRIGQQAPHLMFGATTTAMGFTSQVFRPQLYRQDVLDIRHARGVPPDVRQAFNEQTPVVLRMDVFGAQGGRIGGPYTTPSGGGTHADGEPFKYNERPGERRFLGGTAGGGIVYMPAEVDLADVDDDLEPGHVAPSTGYVVMAPNVCLAFGVPELAQGGVRDGFTFQRDSATVLSIGHQAADGARTSRFTFTSGGTFTASVVGLPAAGLVAVDGDTIITDRDSGWTTPTGTAEKGGHATYDAATITDPPTQAEVQAIADAVQDWSRASKAIIDLLGLTGAHGLLGT